jgi:hypothetical protein
MMNGINQYICQFCQQPCINSIGCKRYGKKARWQRCTNCPVEIGYAINIKGIVQCIMFLTPNSNENHYQLSIDYKEQHTIIEFYKKQHTARNKKVWWKSDQLLQIEHCVKGVTPDNVHDKIKTYILFS